jgi:general secretion pathway protein H
MIVVLVVVALIAGIFVGRMPVRSHGLERRALVDAMVEALRGARGRAIGSNRPVTIAINGEHGRFTVEGGPSLQLPDTLAMTAAAGPGGVARKDLAGIRFAPDGSSSGGRIVLADGKRRTSIGIDWLTGRVSVADVP